MIKYNLSKSTPPFSLLNFPSLMMNPTLFAAHQLIISLWFKSYHKPNSQDFPRISPWFPQDFPRISPCVPYDFPMCSIAPWPPFPSSRRLRWPISTARCAEPRRPAPWRPALCPRGPWFLNQSQPAKQGPEVIDFNGDQRWDFIVYGRIGAIVWGRKPMKNWDWYNYIISLCINYENWLNLFHQQFSGHQQCNYAI